MSSFITPPSAVAAATAAAGAADARAAAADAANAAGAVADALTATGRDEGSSDSLSGEPRASEFKFCMREAGENALFLAFCQLLLTPVPLLKPPSLLIIPLLFFAPLLLLLVLLLLLLVARFAFFRTGRGVSVSLFLFKGRGVDETRGPSSSEGICSSKHPTAAAASAGVVAAAFAIECSYPGVACCACSSKQLCTINITIASCLHLNLGGFLVFMFKKNSSTGFRRVEKCRNLCKSLVILLSAGSLKLVF